MKAQQFLSASLADKRNAETNHSKLSFPPTGGGKRKCSFVFWGFFVISELAEMLRAGRRHPKHFVPERLAGLTP